MLSEPLPTTRTEDGRELPMLVWRSTAGLPAVSSAPLGGGMGVRHWVINATVPMSYDRDDPDRHLTELAAALGLSGPGIGHLTGVDVGAVVAAESGGVRVWATVGLGAPIWAADEPAAPAQLAPVPPPSPAPPQQAAPAPPAPHVPSGSRVGTVNIVAVLPVRLSDAALVNAVATATEAKAQALWELGLAATGTATDAVTVLCAPDGPVEAYGGPRSRFGGPLARAVRRAVLSGGAEPAVVWSDRAAD